MQENELVLTYSLGLVCRWWVTWARGFGFRLLELDWCK